MSLNSIVKDIVNEYIKPKYPIYKVYYIAVYTPEGGEVQKSRRNKIVECLPETNEDGCFENNKMYYPANFM